MLKLGHQLLEVECRRWHHQIDAIHHTALEMISDQAVIELQMTDMGKSPFCVNLVWVKKYRCCFSIHRGWTRLNW